MQGAGPLPLSEVEIGRSDVLSRFRGRELEDPHPAVAAVVLVAEACPLVAGRGPRPSPSSPGPRVLVGRRPRLLRRQDRGEEGIGAAATVTFKSRVSEKRAFIKIHLVEPFPQRVCWLD